MKILRDHAQKVAGVAGAGLLFIVLAGWSFASPVGSSPDEYYHVNSILCAGENRTDRCEKGSSAASRMVSPAMIGVPCYARDATNSASCFTADLATMELEESRRGNFVGAYPPVYYGVASVFASDDIQFTVLAVRLFNAGFATALVCAAIALLPRNHRPIAILAALTTIVPLGLFLIASVNPSSWALVGSFVTPVALHALFLAQTGRSRWLAVGVFAVAAMVAAGARADAAIVVALAAAMISMIHRTRWRLLRSELVVSAAALAAALSIGLSASQLGSAIFGFSRRAQTGGSAGEGAGGPATESGPIGEDLIDNAPASAIIDLELLTAIIVEAPSLWFGALGFAGLGWLDTPMPAVVSLVGLIALGAAMAVAMRRSSPSVAGAAVVVGSALMVIPIWTQYQSGVPVGTQVQPRYVLPLLMLVMVIVLIGAATARHFVISAGQLALLTCSLAVTMPVALYTNIKRYVTGLDSATVNLSSGAEWWWGTTGVGPMALWVLVTLAWWGLLAAAATMVHSVTRRPSVTADPQGLSVARARR